LVPKHLAKYLRYIVRCFAAKNLLQFVGNFSMLIGQPFPNRCFAAKHLAKHIRYFARYFGAIYLRYLEDKYLAKYLRCFARCLDWYFGPK
jgi:hypothetical protein